MQWGSANKPKPEDFKVDHLRTLYGYELEFEPGQNVYAALDYLIPLTKDRMALHLYRQALEKNSPRGLRDAKTRLRKAFKYLDFYFR